MFIKVTVRTSRMVLQDDHMEIADGSDVKSAIAQIAEKYPEKAEHILHLDGLEPLIFRNKVMAYENTVLNDGDEVIISPLIREG